MNLIVAGIAGGVLALIAAIGGVSAYNGSPEGAPSDQLTQYADK